MGVILCLIGGALLGFGIGSKNGYFVSAGGLIWMIGLALVFAFS